MSTRDLSRDALQLAWENSPEFGNQNVLAWCYRLGRADERADGRTYTQRDFERVCLAAAKFTGYMRHEQMHAILAELGFKPAEQDSPHEAPHAHEAAKPAPGLVGPGEARDPEVTDARPAAGVQSAAGSGPRVEGMCTAREHAELCERTEQLERELNRALARIRELDNRTAGLRKA